MSESWWEHPSGVQSILRKEIKIRDDRIEELEAKLAKAVEALRGWIDVANAEGMPVPLSDLEAAQLKGQDDD